jgi:hypothetical protein
LTEGEKERVKKEEPEAGRKREGRMSGEYKWKGMGGE